MTDAALSLADGTVFEGEEDVGGFARTQDFAPCLLVVEAGDFGVGVELDGRRLDVDQVEGLAQVDDEGVLALADEQLGAVVQAVDVTVPFIPVDYDTPALHTFISERQITADPNPGRTAAFRRLNRTEYRNAVRDLLALEVDHRAKNILAVVRSVFGRTVETRDVFRRRMKD